VRQKNKISRDVLVISVLSLLTILVWIGMDVHRKLTQKEVPEILEKQLLPLDPKIDVEIINVLESQLEAIPSSIPAVSEESTLSSQLENEEN